MRRPHGDEPVLITTAPESTDDEYDRRRKKYAIMMLLRVLCVVAAAATYHVSLVLALAFVVGGVVLPWCAVIIANDGPAKSRRAKVMHQHVTQRPERGLPGKTDRTVDG